jgi:hypothetical protein
MENSRIIWNHEVRQANLIAKMLLDRKKVELNRLHRTEAEIIQASVDSMRRGTKKDRREWFQKLKEIAKKIRMTEADEIYSEN